MDLDPRNRIWFGGDQQQAAMAHHLHHMGEGMHFAFATGHFGRDPRGDPRGDPRPDPRVDTLRGWLHGMHRPDWPGFARGPRVRRGDVRAAALALLAEQPRNGYQIIQEITKRSGNVWRPSPGSVYPALQQLGDEGLIEADPNDARLFRLTDAGRAYVESHQEELTAPWATVADTVGEGAIELHTLIAQVAVAAKQVEQAATDRQKAEARRILADTRRALYRLLAEDEPDAAAGDDEEEA
jgi:DNA-binding PadR family transcriptional regulator